MLREVQKNWTVSELVQIFPGIRDLGQATVFVFRPLFGSNWLVYSGLQFFLESQLVHFLFQVSQLLPGFNSINQMQKLDCFWTGD